MREAESEEGHFDVVEIGTSNYDTFLQACAAHPDGKSFAWQFLPEDRDPSKLRGLAIDMKRRYLEELPDLPRWVKVQAAVAEHDGVSSMHHLPVSLVRKWEGIFATCGNYNGFRAMQLARACSSLGRHRILWKVLGDVGLRRLLRRHKVRTQSLGTLFQHRGVSSVGILALDCEGQDCAILRGLLRDCEAQPQLLPKVIIFETNGMNDEVFGLGTEERTVKEITARGYDLEYGGGYRATGRRDTVLRRSW